ncbi:IS1 family transposase, partial [Kluyvera sp. EC_51]|uniref:IS1 family transposase n=1 Tax=Kluyvera sp. EC_51 TaxID=2584089 RepID=UPI002107F228
GKRYPEEFKTEAVKQVVDRGYSVASVATRLDITTHSLYSWIKKYGPDSSTNKEQSDAQAEIRRLQKELKRVTDERDILKKAAVDSIGQRNSYVKTWGCGGFLARLGRKSLSFSKSVELHDKVIGHYLNIKHYQ